MPAMTHPVGNTYPLSKIWLVCWYSHSMVNGICGLRELIADESRGWYERFHNLDFGFDFVGRLRIHWAVPMHMV